MDRLASARRADPFSLPAKDRARFDSLVEASIAELSDAPSIPRSFLARPRRAFEADPNFGSPDTTARPVRANFVSCHPPSAAIKAITKDDPVGTIQKANTRAIALLDYVIRDLQGKRDEIRAGATTADAVEDIPVRESLRTRFGIDADDRNIWVRPGDGRNVATLIARLRGARQILADGWMKYTCVGGPDFPLGDCGRGSCTPPPGFIRHAVTCRGHSRIVLCEPWWGDDPDGQAVTLLHEALHIYFGARKGGRALIGDEGIFLNAHSYEQFVLDMNWL